MRFLPALVLIFNFPLARCAQIPDGALLWLRSDAGISGDASGVSSWADQSGSGYSATQPTAANRPAYINDALRGAAVVRFNGTSSFMIGQGKFPAAGDYTISVVVKINNFSATNNIFSGNSHALYLGGTRFPYVLHGNFGTQAISCVALRDSANILTITYDEVRKNARLYVNGADAGIGFTGANTDTTWFLGAFQSGNLLNGDLAEVLLYPSVLSFDARDSLESSLGAKYAIPIVHPVPQYIPAGATLWLRANAGLTLDSAGVAVWEDKSGSHANAVQSTIAAQPVFAGGVLNGQHALAFNGTSSFMTAPSRMPVRSDYTLTVVLRVLNWGASNNIVSGNTHAHWLGGARYPRVLHGDFNNQAIASIGLTDSANILTFAYTEATKSARIFVNGRDADSGICGANLDSTIFLGAYAQGNFLNAYLGEIILYPRVLRGEERDTVESYLRAKYGIPPGAAPPYVDKEFAEHPSTLQLYARGEDDSATVRISGAITRQNFDSIYVFITRNTIRSGYVSAPLSYTNGVAEFSLAPRIHAELSEYGFTVGLKSLVHDSVLATWDSVVCGDVYLICGQSNSIYGPAGIPRGEFCRTFGLNYSPSAADTLWEVSDGFGYGGGATVGDWGMRLQQSIQDSMHVPNCIINGGVGGTTIEQHQRVDTAPETRTTIYGSMLYRVDKSGLRNAARAMFWYQGESNTVINYYQNFNALYTAWTKDYPKLQQFYVVQIHPGCAAGPHLPLRELQRTLPDSLPRINLMSVLGVPGHDGCHFSVQGYTTQGDNLFRLVKRDFYLSTDTIAITPPNIHRTFFTSSSDDTIALVFDNGGIGMHMSPDTTIDSVVRRMRDAFLLDSTFGKISAVMIDNDTVKLALTSAGNFSTISYIPDQNYDTSAVIYEGPWLLNARGIGALSFHRFPITARPSSVKIIPQTVAPGITMHEDAAGNSIASIVLPREMNMTVEVFDLLGRAVAVPMRNIFSQAGTQSVPLSLILPGWYCCRVTTAAGVAAAGFVKR